MVNVPARIDEADSFDAVADDAQRIVGDSCKFNKTHYVVNGEKADLVDESYIAYHVRRVWQKWHDHRVVATIEDEPGRPFPFDVEGIDDDSGEPGEWQKTFYLYLQNVVDAGDMTFITSSHGGRRAVETLCSKIRNMRRRRPGCLPVIRLDIGSFPSRQYGRVPCPNFVVTGWVTQEGLPYPEPQKEQQQGNIVALPGTRVNDLDDDIPF
jgi:hypothetical protein